jgi:hypothetical protein
MPRVWTRGEAAGDGREYDVTLVKLDYLLFVQPLFFKIILIRHIIYYFFM